MATDAKRTAWGIELPWLDEPEFDELRAPDGHDWLDCAGIEPPGPRLPAMPPLAWLLIRAGLGLVVGLVLFALGVSVPW